MSVRWVLVMGTGRDRSFAVSMTPEELKACGRRIVDELFNQGDLTVIDQLIDPDFREYVVADGEDVSAADVRDYVTEIRRAFPDLRSHIDLQVAEGDLLVQRLTITGTHDGEPFRGLPATGRQFRISLAEISQMGPNGRFVRRWTLHDALGLLRQLGALPTEAVPS